MDVLMTLVGFVLHVDKYLEAFVTHYGAWVYALLFLIIFVETGVVVFPFLPGDSLLFVVGALCGVGTMNYPVSVLLLIAAAVLGNQSNYTIGRHFGPRVFQWEDSRYFNKRAFQQAHAFYEKYGGITIVLARFMPFLRTFAPFVAGVAEMTRSRFTLFDVTGGTLWVGGVITAGYFFGSIPWVKDNLEKIIWAMILVPGLLVLFGAWKSRRKAVGAQA
ncbi:VTT domain-containing protein [Ramlibacter ginsenosidimutans]|uniref:VTT domain-containing protein n=1 Tax=Ramlibacter ginsenosidimutans TaxID=502333 RepID=A0A934U1V8_9BURK|nr:VTT domain-containing protein [Ramlibacter ginsenosidimutans]MBK6009367.1 VTT domain-containing protein [Ramlibacter ginsenosidimutans]